MVERSSSVWRCCEHAHKYVMDELIYPENGGQTPRIVLIVAVTPIPVSLNPAPEQAAALIAHGIAARENAPSVSPWTRVPPPNAAVSRHVQFYGTCACLRSRPSPVFRRSQMDRVRL